ncbi:MAG: phosphoglycerate mutase [Rhodospirillaceae bacterium]|nr:phosphoglycerate mutase [Rhodospirillaceae bacterium]|tara:strand:+ start:35547 stop:36164 length:618 start_codon:yes stop_codon:yes gene_type:complete
MTPVTTRFWWIRHAPVINPDRMLYGHSDIAADFSDDDAFNALARRLPEDAVWVTTTLTRARMTAEKLARCKELSPDILYLDDLREQYFGDWEGSSWDKIPEDEQAPYWRDAVNNRAPNGESFGDVTDRVSKAVNSLLKTNSAQDIIIVAHAGSIRAAIAMAAKADAHSGLSFHAAPLSLTRIDAIDREGELWWRIESVNLPAISA